MKEKYQLKKELQTVNAQVQQLRQQQVSDIIVILITVCCFYFCMLRP